MAVHLLARNAQQSRWAGCERAGQRSEAIRNHGGSYISASDKRLHFGLGAAEVAKVEIHWPSGIHQVLEGVKVNQFLEVREPEKS